MLQSIVAFIEATGQFGLAVGLVIYYIIRDSRRDKQTHVRDEKRDVAIASREEAMTKRIQQLEEEYRKELTSLISSTNSTNTALAKSSARVTRSVDSLVRAISDRPCVANASIRIPHPDCDDPDSDLYRPHPSSPRF